MNAILLASAGLVVLLVSGGVGFWLGRSGVGGGKARVEKAEAELEEYKRSVTEHFGQTAAHFQAIGKQYRELYEHMASGAQVLCEPDEAGQPLLFAPGVDAEQRVAEEAADVPAEERQAGRVDEAAKTAIDTGEESAPEAAVEPQPKAKDEAGERTLH